MTLSPKKRIRLTKLIVILIILGKSSLQQTLEAIRDALYDNLTDQQTLTMEQEALVAEIDAAYISIDSGDDPENFDENTVDLQTDTDPAESSINSVYEIWRGTLD